MDNNEYRAWQAGEVDFDEEYSDFELTNYSIEALEKMLHTDPLPALTCALWETIRDHLPVDRKEKLIAAMKETATNGDDGAFGYILMEEVAYSYAINYNAQNSIDDFCLAVVRDQLVDELERGL